MDHIENNTNTLAVLVDISWDRLMYAGAIAAGLVLGVALAS